MAYKVVSALFALGTAVATNPSHYGNPTSGCESDEIAVRVTGVTGDFCSPQCSSSGACPKDIPKGDTAMPMCALQTPTGQKYCALICSFNAECGTGTCQQISGVGLCTYAAPSSAAVAAEFQNPFVKYDESAMDQEVNGRRIMYDRTVVPEPYSMGSRAHPHQRMRLVFAVKQQNLDVLEQKFWEVADPKSPKWRDFMTIEEIGTMVASPKDMEVVRSWLTSSLGKDVKVKEFYDSMQVIMSVADVERLFDTQVFNFVQDTGRTILRSMGKYSVPVEVGRSIDFVEGLSEFPMPREKAVKGTPNAGTPLVVPQTLTTMYSVPATAQSLTSQCAAEFQNDASYNQYDLERFCSSMNIPNQTVSYIVGPYDGVLPDTEATLDVQYLLGVSPNQTNWYWTETGWMYSFANSFFATKSVPEIVSISWGWSDVAQCSNVASATCSHLGIKSDQYVARVNTEFQKIGLRGVSLLTASGDSGANGRTHESCLDWNLHAIFPGSSPYVTAVGATQLENPQFNLPDAPPACSQVGLGTCASGGEEVAVSYQQAHFTSGGGFSTYVAMPDYQKSAVSHYLSTMANELPAKHYFKRGNRAYPDVAAMGSNFVIELNDAWGTVGGTSAASPTFAAVVAYLNALAKEKDGKPLGFLNNFLYQMYAEDASTFTDVSKGDNRCTESGCLPWCKGFKAAPGWDPVTGLGTPVASKMLTYLEGLLTPQPQVVV